MYIFTVEKDVKNCFAEEILCQSTAPSLNSPFLLCERVNVKEPIT